MAVPSEVVVEGMTIPQTVLNRWRWRAPVIAVLVVVVAMLWVGVFIGYAIGSNDNTIPTRAISGVVTNVNVDGTKVCLTTGVGDSNGVCSRNVSDFDVLPGDEVTGLVLTVPIEDGTQELLYLEPSDP
jgi:hypothetical protein